MNWKNKHVEDKLTENCSSIQNSIQSKLEEMMSGNLPPDGFDQYYDQEGLSLAAAVKGDLSALEMHSIIAIAKNRIRSPGQSQGYSNISTVKETIGVEDRKGSKLINSLVKASLAIKSPCGEYIRLNDSGLHILNKMMEPWVTVKSLQKKVEDLVSVLNAFHVDAEKATSLLNTPEHLWLDRCGLYVAALAKSFGKLTPDMHNPDSDSLMHEWLWTLPSYTTPENGQAEAHQKEVYEKWISKLIME